ncbi:LuxR C-terminal-related transcriptional regulator [Parabacteroides sp. OttesenSCG-928-G06]|nr:LuxR C-terminal-related transcriptional regulator [Parabacteroides sp. OttesenSCG-928-K15]MDL2281751.1 LuxR C-terminal-related transcriptional regulator [Parabacteroides sp. OttesenSCG-928-G06]
MLRDTLQCLGLQYLLNEYFPSLTVHCCDAQEALPETMDYYITSADTFLVYADFFLPRRNKTFIILDRSEGACAPSATHAVSKEATAETLIEQLQLFFASEGGVFSPGENNKDLSIRETDVLQLIVKGITNKEIADKLNISLNTVLTHRKNITSKLGIKTVSGLTFYALMHGIVSGDEFEI